MEAPVRFVAVGLEISIEIGPKNLPAVFHQGRIKLFSEDDIAPLLKLTQLVFNPDQLSMSVVHYSARSSLPKQPLKVSRPCAIMW